MVFDVGVIGAGIHGSSAAFHLASRGLRVAIFEREGPASGPTGRSSAICRAYYTNPFLARCARDSIEMFKRFPEAAGGGNADFRHTGLLFLHPPEDVDRVRESAGRLRELDIEVDMLEPNEIAARFSVFDLAGIGIAAWERNAGYADPAGATAGLFRGAVGRGAEAVLGHRITAVRSEDGGGATVETEAGTRVRCRRVLIAAGPWTRRLAAEAGVDLPLTVERHIVGVYRWGDARPAPAHGDLVGGYYFRPEGEDSSWWARSIPGRRWIPTGSPRGPNSGSSRSSPGRSPDGSPSSRAHPSTGGGPACTTSARTGSR